MKKLLCVNILISGTTLAVVLVGAKKMHDEIEDVRTKTRKAVRTMQNNMNTALNNLEI